MSAATLVVDNLSAAYGRAQVLFDLSFDVRPGEAVALLGRNGAGKSTTMRALVGLVKKTGRSAVGFCGEDVTTLPTHAIVRRGLGYVPEDRRIFADLTTQENLEVGRQTPRDGAPEWTPDSIYEIFPKLSELRGRLGARMSGGEQQMLAIARTLMGNPILLLLDEPSEGLAPRIIEDLIEAIAKMKRAGLGLLISEQNLPVARLLADRVLVIEKGVRKFCGTLGEFDADPQIRDAYLAL